MTPPRHVKPPALVPSSQPSPLKDPTPLQPPPASMANVGDRPLVLVRRAPDTNSGAAAVPAPPPSAKQSLLPAPGDAPMAKSSSSRNASASGATLKAASSTASTGKAEATVVDSGSDDSDCVVEEAPGQKRPRPASGVAAAQQKGPAKPAGSSRR